MGVKIREKYRGSGVYWCFVNNQGRRTSFKAGSYKAAQVAAEYYEAKLLTDPDSLFTTKARTAPIFRAMSKRWLENVELRESTIERYSHLLESWILPAIGSKKVDTINRADVKAIITAAQKAGLSRSSLELILTALNNVLREALDSCYIDSLPTNEILRKVKGKRKPPNPFDRESWEAFITAADRIEPYWALALRFMFYTGCRLGEILAVEWDDIDWPEKKVTFNKAFRRSLAGTKTDVHRNVDLADELIPPLRQHWMQTMTEVLADASEKPSIIFHLHGVHCNQNHFRRVFERIQKAAGQTGRHPHDIRHTTASMLLSLGANVMYVAKHLGHSSTKMTLDVYGQWLPQDGPTQVNLLSNSKQ